MQPRPQRDAPARGTKSRRAASLLVSSHARARLCPHGRSHSHNPCYHMTQLREDVIAYKRARFATRLPVARRYTLSHFWLREEEPGLWRVGFAKFAARMLGDLVEYDFSVPVGASVQVGQSIGWVEGFKAVSDVYCVV